MSHLPSCWPFKVGIGRTARGELALARTIAGWQGSETKMQKNYQFEKRRKEMDKKAKKEEKRRRKLEAEHSAPAGDSAVPSVPVDPVS
jgi:hypothetical protein